MRTPTDNRSREGAGWHRVPNLKFDLAILNIDHAGSELYADGQVVHRLKSLVRELQQ